MPINASPHFQKAEAEYLTAQTTEQKIRALRKMMALSPKHKGAENLNAQLKRRLAKLKYTKEKESKSSKGSGQKGIKKEEMQAVIIGFTNSGKSTLLKKLTNVEPEIADYEFTTKQPLVGMMPFSGTKIQLVEIPAINSEYYDRGLVHTADVILAIVRNIEDIPKINKELEDMPGKKLIVFNSSESNNRKIEATLKSKRYNFYIIDLSKELNIEEFGERIFKEFGRIRVFTKPDNQSKKSERPMIFYEDATVKEMARKILKNLSALKETKIWGPSSKFPGQIVGLNHKLKDLDTIEFKTR